METTGAEIDMSSLKSALTTSSLSQQVNSLQSFENTAQFVFIKKKVKFGKKKLNVIAEKLCNFLQRLENLFERLPFAAGYYIVLGSLTTI